MSSVDRIDSCAVCEGRSPSQEAPSLDRLIAAKRSADLTVSVCIPARDEEATIGGVVASVVGELVDLLVDEVIVVDDGSVDKTGVVAHALGARVLRHPRSAGKGAAMEKAAAAAVGDIVVFLDADVQSFCAHFVRGLLGPMLTDDRIQLVKGCYHRPLHDGADGGGRVTELLARPLLRHLFPDLAFLRQPLAGEVAVRRQALVGLVFDPGYGVEVAMLLDVARQFGAGAIVEVDLGERVHRNRSLLELAGEADEVLGAVLARTALGKPRPDVF